MIMQQNYKTFHWSVAKDVRIENHNCFLLVIWSMILKFHDSWAN